MGSPYAKAKGRRGGETFLALPHAVLKCDNYKQLSHIARSLLVDIARQYNGSNNGDLTACYSFLKERGWKSKTTISKHIKELIHYGMIIKVQAGGINCGGRKRPSLYAISWTKIDKIGYSDGHTEPSNYRVGEVVRSWRIKQEPLKT